MDPAGVLQVYPWLEFNAKEISVGHFPLWNPYTAVGQPHLANLQTAVFFPYWWLWFLAGGGPRAYGFLVLGRLFVSALFIFVFARSRLCGFWGSAAAGAAYAFGGYGLWFSQLVDLNSQMLLPLLFLAWPALLHTPSLRAFLASALLTALVVLGGHPSAAFVTLFVAGLYTLCSFLIKPPAVFSALERSGHFPLLVPRPLQRLLPIGWAGALGVLLSGLVLLPFLNYFSRCWTIHGPGFGFFHLDPRAFFNLLLPGVSRLFSDMPSEIPVKYISFGPLAMMRLAYAETAVPGNLPGAGLLICGLAFYTILKARKLPWPALFFTGLLVLLLGLTLGLPGFRLVALLPPLNLNSNFKFFFSEVHLCLAILAGLAVDDLGKSSRKKSRLPRPVIPLVVSLALLIVFLFLFQAVTSRHGRGPNLEVMVVAMFNAFVLISFYIWIRAWPNKIALVISALLFLSSLFFHKLFVSPFVKLDLPSPPLVGEAARALGLSPGREERLAGLERYWPANRLMLHRLKDIRSSDALFYKPYVQMLNRVNGMTGEQSLRYFYPSYFTRVSPGKFLSPSARRLSIAGLVSPGPWVPAEIIDQALAAGTSLYSLSPPTRQVFSLAGSGGGRGGGGAGGPRQYPGLFLHSPARFDFFGRDVLDPEASPLGSLSLHFIPLLMMPERPVPAAGGDGVVFNALIGRGSGRRLVFSWFETPEREGRGDGGYQNFLRRVSVPISAGDKIELSTLPGPRDNRERDWSGFGGLSVSAGDSLESAEWKAGDEGPRFYPLPHLPWCHEEGGKEGLRTVRRAGDEVEVEVSGERSSALRGGDDSRVLVVHEAWYPGWGVEVDGAPARILIPEDKVSWRVPLPAGARKVIFRFVPVDFRIGWFASLVSALICLALSLRGKKRTTKQNGSEK